MHTQVLVIFPKDVELDDIMYWYQEIDKVPGERMADERCQWHLMVEEKEIPTLLIKIKEGMEQKRDENLEKIIYRSKHSCEEYKKHYERDFHDGTFDYYKMLCDHLNEYENVKDLPIDHPKQIEFIIDYSWYGDVDYMDMYIKGEGYGHFDNPYQMWDYWRVVNERRFPSHTMFLVSKTGKKKNKMIFNDMDIKETIKNIETLTRVWEYVIFCEKDPKNTKVYTTDKIRFGNPWNEHCLVENLEDVVTELQDVIISDDYIVTALDFHW